MGSGYIAKSQGDTKLATARDLLAAPLPWLLNTAHRRTDAAGSLLHRLRPRTGEPMDPKDILQEAERLIKERGVNYGGIEQNFERAASLASLKLNKTVTAYDVAIVLESVKDARRATAPDHYDSHIDGINYRAFALMLSCASKDTPTVQEMVVKLNGARDE